MTENIKTYWRQKKLKKLFLEQLRKTPIVSLVSEKIGVPRSTYYRWVKEDPDFWLQAQETYIEWVRWLNDMATSQLMKLVKECDRNSILFWLRTRDPEFWWVITRVQKPEGMAGLSKEKREILQQLLAHREAVYNDMMERKNAEEKNDWDPNYSDNPDDLNDLPPNMEEMQS